MTNKVVTTPPVPALGWVAVDIPQVWFAAFAILILGMSFMRPDSNVGWRLVGGGALALIAYVHVVSTGRRPPVAQVAPRRT